MLEWYNDNKLGIYFDKAPFIVNRYPTPEMTAREKKSIAKFPFANMRQLEVRLIDRKKGKSYAFTIPEKYYWDGGTIPRVFWRLIGAPTDPRFLIASLIHDQLCENRHYIDNDRNFSSRVFKALLLEAGVSKVKTQTMYLAVDNYQRFCGWGK